MTDKAQIDKLLDKLKAKDESHYHHALRVRDIMTKCVPCFDLSKEENDQLTTAAVLHDIGVLNIPDHILRKKARLKLDEYEQIQDHVSQGQDLIADLPDADKIGPIIRHHHENMNGFGYPDGIAGEKIPFGARLLHIIEAFDSMVNPRHAGKNDYTPELAVAELKDYSGRIYDGKILAKVEDILLAVKPES